MERAGWVHGGGGVGARRVRRCGRRCSSFSCRASCQRRGAAAAIFLSCVHKQHQTQHVCNSTPTSFGVMNIVNARRRIAGEGNCSLALRPTNVHSDRFRCASLWVSWAAAFLRPMGVFQGAPISPQTFFSEEPELVYSHGDGVCMWTTRGAQEHTHYQRDHLPPVEWMKQLAERLRRGACDSSFLASATSTYRTCVPLQQHLIPIGGGKRYPFVL
ncbi:hypothetical protein BOTBODRAFT_490783 [Botryobasidium botryosum FD-172 SS1]|uniref:Uncharacterized protein n=1 Tax=Botryobasidium botryosum (strain FD-172 SS1) TaxID=930990 RepID=A0A067MG89_BOTB1|nr:hypothetical protein BOTBODRAFT_490783 [Botryobasidium botryosum FD-172 SS1]